jgi:glycine hydroxymethyltransferase
MIILDFSQTELNGSIAEKALDQIGISTSKSTIPDDPNPPFRPSGLRIGTPAMTTRGVKEDDMRTIVDFMDQAFKLARQENNEAAFAALRQEIINFAKKFPVPGV